MFMECHTIVPKVRCPVMENTYIIDVRNSKMRRQRWFVVAQSPSMAVNMLTRKAAIMNEKVKVCAIGWALPYSGDVEGGRYFQANDQPTQTRITKR